MRRIAVVIEDDDDLRHLLTQTLEQHGFDVHAFSDGAPAVDAVRLLRPELTTVDVMLGGIDGFEAVRRIRSFHDGYILIISAVGDETATVEGFRSGADDYIVKPWRPYELRARIDALMRRPRGIRSDEPSAPAWLEAGALRLNPAARRVELDGELLDLTRSEFDVLQALMQRPGDVIEKSRIALMLRRQNGAAGEHVSAHDLHAVEVHMMNLRRKLGDDGRSGRWVETVRGIGYRFARQSD
ncbi:response regulator transcription factor [Microbacterium thalli]|uniref:Response regulator transcription factor n=1 Tax=Microbacterium thalli TaxID=3027921 RepID=A0ABT5SED9_9MICO|nr:response regulator transcription factor [Microbacterium thalli]MDD7928599.1 response regulator transcription factor [Microbacterium thalli]MDD7961185.1 response regulator transcription factor [Microbacterium thalli]